MNRSVIGHAAIRQMEAEHLWRCRERERALTELTGESAATQGSEHRLTALRHTISEIRCAIGPHSGIVPRRRSVMRIR